MRRNIAAFLCLLFGPFFAWHGLADIVTGMRAKSWPTVQGIVTTASLQETPGRRGRTTYTPFIRYDYEVKGTSYTGDRVDIGDKGTSSRTDATATLNRYNEGKVVTVHYHSKDPQSSFLEVGTTADNWLALGIGLVMAVIGGLWARSLWQKLHSNEYTAESGL